MLLAGVATVLVPATGPEHMDPLRAAAVVVATVGAIAEAAWWLVLPRWRRHRQLRRIEPGAEPATGPAEAEQAAQSG
jgi:hypothetical protein